MKDNPVCLQVNWDENEEFIHAWTEVNTLKLIFFVFVMERLYIGMSDNETCRGMIASQDDFININDIIFCNPTCIIYPRLSNRF